jgi:hypothetical protein
LGLNFYDYGARNYDATLGRFFNLDKYSDAYFHITPYQYTANNPVKLIDINGEYIWIYENGNKYKYINGKVYSQNKETKEYDQEYTAEKGSYVAQMQGYLDQIGCDDCSAGKELLGFFENDERNITIRENKEKRPRYKERNAFNDDGNTVLTFINQKNYIPTVDGFESISKNFFTTLGHELGHAQSHFLYGPVTDELWYIQYDSDGSNPQKVKKDEVYATFIENKIRSENKLPLRTHYSAESEFKVNESSRVLNKVKGNWIMTTEARLILNAIQSPSNRK